MRSRRKVNKVRRDCGHPEISFWDYYRRLPISLWWDFRTWLGLKIVGKDYIVMGCNIPVGVVAPSKTLMKNCEIGTNTFSFRAKK